jgi:Fe-Mn family superoxide dismutase
MRDIITLLEEKSKPQDIEIIPLNFTEREVSPVISKSALDLHYGKLAHGYAERYNSKEGDCDFNYAGVFLHNLLFTQFREYRGNNKPNGPIAGFIDKHFKGYDNFRDEFTDVALTIQGSGWVYLSSDGSIKSIKNHEVRDDILVLVDMWEHAFLLDYGSDKKKYLSDQWKIINWNVISTRWGKNL